MGEKNENSSEKFYNFNPKSNVRCGAWGTCEMKKFDWLEFVCVPCSARAACQARGMTNQRDPSRAKYLVYFR